MEYQKESTVVRENLAAYRTDLANERTVLAYARTALTLFVLGVTFIKFFDNLTLTIIGSLFIPIGVMTGIFGVRRYQLMRARTQRLRRQHHLSTK